MEIQTSGKSIDSLLEKVLSMNILSSDYFKQLFQLKTYHEVIDEIYNQVDHVEPWMTGNCRGPSSAFCLLYKCFTMKLTVNQMHGLLNHQDSPFIRAIGFLYLRYVGDPKTLWNWFQPYVKDDEEFSPGSSGRNTTMGVYVRDLLLGQYYFDTLFPRIPVPVMRQIVSNLEKMNLPTKHSGTTGETQRHGSDDTARRPPSVKAALSVSFGQRAPHRASTRDSSPVRRSLPRLPREGTSGEQRRSPSGHSKSRDYSDKDHSDRERDRYRDSRRDRERTRDRDRDWDRDQGRSRDRDDRYDGDRRTTNAERESRKDYEKRYYRERSSRRSRSQSRSRSRSRSRSQSRSMQADRQSSPQRERNKDKNVVSNNMAKLRDLYGDLGDQKSGGDLDRIERRDGSGEEVIRLGASTWK